MKWGAPCYTWKGKNVVGIGGFKSYFGLWFHQGALLNDDAGVFVNAQEGKTKALRQWRMNAASDIEPVVIRRYVKEAIASVDGGREIKAEPSTAVVVPDELQKALQQRFACCAPASNANMRTTSQAQSATKPSDVASTRSCR